MRVYRGSDGSFALYDDQGDTYAYEKGAHAIIPMQWDDKSEALTIGARQGDYPGMPREKIFRVVVVDGANGPAPIQVRYTGQPLVVRFE